MQVIFKCEFNIWEVLKRLGNNISQNVNPVFAFSKTSRWTNLTFKSIQKKHDTVKTKNIVSKSMYSYSQCPPKDVPLSCKALFLGFIFSSHMCTLIIRCSWSSPHAGNVALQHGVAALTFKTNSCTRLQVFGVSLQPEIITNNFSKQLMLVHAVKSDRWSQ